MLGAFNLFGHLPMKLSLLPVAALLVSGTPAHALCVYHGELYAKSTLAGELAESSLVVKATVIGDQWMRPWGDSGEAGSLYTLRVQQTFKGASTQTITFFTERNSGAFYLDKGETYLLFLRPYGSATWRPHVGDAYGVNYNCGQSGPWDEVPVSDRGRLAKKDF